MNLEEKISTYLDEENLNESVFFTKGIVTSGGKKYSVNLPVSADDEKGAEEKFREMVNREIKNGHFPKDTEIQSVKIQ